MSINNITYQGNSFSIPLINGGKKKTDLSLSLIQAVNTFQVSPKISSISNEILQHQIKDAAERIFDDPLRSFLEVVVNGLDASVSPEKQTGKFGMGFLSILSFLHYEETEGADINIETTYKKGSSLCSYKIEVDVEMQPRFYESEMKKETGTTVTLVPKRNQFSEKTLSRLHSYLYYLQFYEHGKIFVKRGTQISFIGRGEKTLVEVVLSENKIEVIDKGCGIDKEVAKSKLFVPSASTKDTICKKTLTPTLPEFVTYEGKQEKASHFLISIGGVVVIDLPLDKPLFQDLHLKMPPNTKLTLARNAVAFSEKDKSAQRYLKGVIDLTIDSLIKKECSSEHLLGLYRGFKRWEQSTPSVKKGGLTYYIEEQLYERVVKGEKILVIPFEQKDSLLPILKHDLVIPLHGELVGNDFLSLENRLATEIQADVMLIEGKKVIFVDTIKEVTSLNLRTLLFVPTSFIEYAKERAPLEGCSVEKILAFSIATHFTEEGSQVQPHKSLLDVSLSSTKQSDDGLIFTSKLSGTDLQTPFNRDLTLWGKVFEGYPSEPFEAFLQEYDDKIYEQLLEANIYADLHYFIKYILMAKIDKEFYLSNFVEASKNRIFFNESTNKYYIVANISVFNEGILKLLNSLPTHFNINEKNLLILKDKIQTFFDKKECFEELDRAKRAKVLFVRLFLSLIKITSPLTRSKLKLFLPHFSLWPLPTPLTKEHLHRTFKTLFQYFPGQPFHNKKLIFNPSPLPPSEQAIQKIEMFKDKELYLNFSLRDKIAPIALLESIVLKSSEISTELKTETEKFTSSVLSLYNTYVTFSDHELRAEYGEETKDVFLDELPYTQESNCQEIYQVLFSLKENPVLYKKLLRLTLEEMRDNLSIQNRNLHLKKQGIVLFSCFHGKNVLTLIAYLKEYIPLNLLYFVLTHVHTYEELLLVEFLLYDPKILSKLKKVNQTIYENILISVIKVYIQQELSEEQLSSFYITLKSFHFEGIYKILNYKSINKYNFIKTISSYIKNALDQEQTNLLLKTSCFIAEDVSKQLESAQPFRVKQLLNTLTEEDIGQMIFEKSLETTVSKIASFSDQSEMNIVKQSVEDSTERKPEDATILECLQNSIDAAQSFGPKEMCRETVTFSVELVQSEKDPIPQMALKIKDEIGMDSLKTLLINFLVPGYSEKEGQMGNGAYQMYKDAEMVTVKTRLLKDPSKVYLLRVVPFREKGEVVDLTIKCIEPKENEQFIGTEIHVLYQNLEKTEKQVELEGLGTLQYIRETVGKTWVKLPSGRPVVLKLKGEKEEILNSIALDALTVTLPKTTAFTFVKMENQMASGFVLTNGYPFKPLAEFLKEHKLLSPQLADQYTKGWSLNLSAESFTPVQSRTKVHIKETHLKELKKLIAECLFSRALIKEEVGPGTSFFPHLNSDVHDFSQIYPHDGKTLQNEELIEKLPFADESFLPTFFLHYVPLFSSKSFLEYIDEGYRTLVPTLSKRKKLLKQELLKNDYEKTVFAYKKGCLEIFSEWKKPRAQNNFLRNVIFPWFEKKVISFSEDVPTLEYLKLQHLQLRTKEEQKTYENEVEHIKDVSINELNYTPKLIPLATQILTSYCGTVKIKLYHDPCSTTQASYSLSHDTIAVNLAKNKLSDILVMGLRIAMREPLEMEKLITITPGQAGIINHELLHRRDGSSCIGKNVHGDGQDAKGRMVSFEARAASWARKKMSEEGYDRWSEEIQQLMKDLCIQTKKLMEDIEKLRELEKELPALTMKMLLK